MQKARILVLKCVDNDASDKAMIQVTVPKVAK